MHEPAESSATARLARKQYEQGMKDLGRSLIVLASLQAVDCLFSLAARVPPWLGILVGVLAPINFTLGCFALRRHLWVNIVVVVFAGLQLLLNLAALGQQDPGQAGASAGSCVGVLILVALMYYSLNNLRMYLEIPADEPFEGPPAA